MANAGGKPRSGAGSPATLARKKAEKADRLAKRRRNRILLAVAAVVVVAAVLGLIFGLMDSRERAVRDLSAIGKGVPAVVQVHDTTCPICTELRRTVGGIQGEFSDEDLLIRVADVHTEEGLAFAARYTAERRVTLLYLDGNGELVTIQSGARDADALRRDFRLHAAGEL